MDLKKGGILSLLTFLIRGIYLLHLYLENVVCCNSE